MSSARPLIAILAVSLLAPISQAAVTIWPLGDSITYGWSSTTVSTPGGYREPMYEQLTAKGWNIHFVGAQTGNAGALQTANNEVAHDGYPKYTIGQDDENLDGDVQPPSTSTTGNMPSNNGGYWLTGHTGLRPAITPDITLLLIGTNDVRDDVKVGMAQDQILPTMEADLNHLLNKIYSYLPDTHIFLASIPPDPIPTDTEINTLTQQYNQFIESQAVPAFQAAGRNITFVDQYSYFLLADGTPNTALYGDNVHPNASGYQLMGTTWANALAAAVPEPASCALLLPALLLVARRRSRASVQG